MKKLFVQSGKALGYFGIYIAGQLAGGVAAAVLSLIQLMTSPDNTKDQMTRYQELINYNLGYGLLIAAVITLAVYVIIFAARKKKITEELDIRKISVKEVVITIIGGIGTICFMDFITDILPLPESLMEEFTSGNESLAQFPLWVSISTTALLVPILEEVVFRGLIYSRLGKAMPAVVAAVLSSVVFGLMHEGLLWAVWAGIVGLIICVARVKTGSIIPGIIIHVMVNGFAVICDNVDILGDITKTKGTVITLTGAVLLALYTILMCVNKTPKAEVTVATVDE